MSVKKDMPRIAAEFAPFPVQVDSSPSKEAVVFVLSTPFINLKSMDVIAPTATIKMPMEFVKNLCLNPLTVQLVNISIKPMGVLPVQDLAKLAPQPLNVLLVQLLAMNPTLSVNVHQNVEMVSLLEPKLATLVINTLLDVLIVKSNKDIPAADNLPSVDQINPQ